MKKEEKAKLQKLIRIINEEELGNYPELEYLINNFTCNIPHATTNNFRNVLVDYSVSKIFKRFFLRKGFPDSVFPAFLEILDLLEVRIGGTVINYYSNDVIEIQNGKKTLQSKVDKIFIEKAKHILLMEKTMEFLKKMGQESKIDYVDMYNLLAHRLIEFRKDFAKISKEMYSLHLSDEKWDRYFEIAKAEMSGDKGKHTRKDSKEKSFSLEVPKWLSDDVIIH